MGRKGHSGLLLKYLRDVPQTRLWTDSVVQRSERGAIVNHNPMKEGFSDDQC